MTRVDNEKWSKLLSSLPKEVERHLQPKAMADALLDEDEQAYAASLTALPLALVERLGRPETQEAVDVDVPLSWCVCEMPEGDFPRVRVFNDFETMARHVGKLEGDEVSVWIFYGTPIPITQPGRDGARHMITSRREAFRIPRGEREEVSSIVIENKTVMTLQDDGWLGDPSLTETATAAYYVHESPKDDEFDPDDGGDNTGEPLGI